jgi:hypothetical protein
VRTNIYTTPGAREGMCFLMWPASDMASLLRGNGIAAAWPSCRTATSFRTLLASGISSGVIAMVSIFSCVALWTREDLLHSQMQRRSEKIKKVSNNPHGGVRVQQLQCFKWTQDRLGGYCVHGARGSFSSRRIPRRKQKHYCVWKWSCATLMDNCEVALVS